MIAYTFSFFEKRKINGDQNKEAQPTENKSCENIIFDSSFDFGYFFFSHSDKMAFFSPLVNFSGK